MNAARATAWAACVVVATGTPASAAEPFDGRWAAEAQACIGERGVASPIVVNSLSLQWRDAACVVRTSYRVRGAWHIGARCWGEGVVSNVPITLRMRGEQLLLAWAGAPAEELRRCP